jgi:hypothetical protein
VGYDSVVMLSLEERVLFGFRGGLAIVEININLGYFKAENH